MINWPQHGVSVAVLAGFYVVLTEGLRTQTFYHLYRWHILAALIAIGIVLWVSGKVLRWKHKRRISEGGGGVGGDGTVTRNFLGTVFSPVYWGPMLLVFGGIVYLCPAIDAEKEILATSEAAIPVRAATPFPDLRMQGLTYRKKRSTVIINGKTLMVGDVIEGAQLVQIGPDSATINWRGYTNVLLLGR